MLFCRALRCLIQFTYELGITIVFRENEPSAESNGQVSTTEIDLDALAWS